MTIHELKDIIKVKTELLNDETIKISAGVILHVSKLIPRGIPADGVKQWIEEYQQAAIADLSYKMQEILKVTDDVVVESYYKEDK